MLDESDQRALLEHITDHGTFNAREPDDDEDKDEQKMRVNFEQRVLRMGGNRLRHHAALMGLLPELVVTAWRADGEVLAQVIFHAYRCGMRVSENMDVVFGGTTVDEKKAERPTPVEGQERKTEETVGEKNVWDDYDEFENEDFAGTNGSTTTSENDEGEKEAETNTEPENTEEHPPKEEKQTKVKAKRPEKTAVDQKLDAILKAVNAASDNALEAKKTADGFEKRLKAVHTQTTAIELLAKKIDLSFEELLGGTIRSMLFAKRAAMASVPKEKAKEFLGTIGQKTSEMLTAFNEKVDKALPKPKTKGKK